ncbi:universal stress protein [Nocardioides pacificus]
MSTTPNIHKDPTELPAVVVGVDGSIRNKAAVAWARAEAAATGRPLDLLAVLDTTGFPVPWYGAVPDDEPAWQALDEIAHEVARDLPGTTARRDVVNGPATHVLLEGAKGQELLVVGKRGKGTFARALVGSTSIAVAGRASIPVVVVPDEWVPAEHDAGCVVVGVAPEDLHPDTIHRALHEARRRGVELVVAHGWEVPAVLAWDETLVRDTYQRAESDHAEALEAVVAPYRSADEDVVIRAVSRRGHPANVLLDVADECGAQLLVLGRHDLSRLGGFPLGAVPRAVLHYAHVPVMVVPGEQP